MNWNTPSKGALGLALLAPVLLASQCAPGHGDGYRHQVPPPPVADWHADMDGLAYDAWGWPFRDEISQVAVVLHPLGQGKYAVQFDGLVDFVLFDPWDNALLGREYFDLAWLDGQTGDYFPEPYSHAYGEFDFWGGGRWYLDGLGWTDVDFGFTLRPLDGDLVYGGRAVFDWWAEFYSAGDFHGALESYAYYEGYSTTAINFGN
ncbi:MAG TPA: hypothetical protein VGC54_06890 [Planctomycetota bacterium]